MEAVLSVLFILFMCFCVFCGMSNAAGGSLLGFIGMIISGTLLFYIM